MVNTVSTATESDKKQELLNMNWTEFSDEDKKDLASSLSIQNIDEYMNAIQSDDTIDAQKKEEILDNLLDVRKAREKMDSEGADAVVEEAKKVLEIQNEKDFQKGKDLEKVESLKSELADEGVNQEVSDLEAERDRIQGHIDEMEAQEYETGNAPVGLEAERQKLKEKELQITNIKMELDSRDQGKQEQEKVEEVEEIQNELDPQQVDSLRSELADRDQKLKNKDEKIDALQKDVEALRNQLRELSDKNVRVLDELRKARNSKDKETIAKQKDEIRRLQAEKDSIRDRYLGALPRYGGDIKTLETKWVEFKLLGSQSINGQKVLSGPQLKFRQNLRSRRRINTTVQKLNEIGNNPKKGVQFVLTRTFGYDPLNVSGKVGSGFKNVRKFFKIRDVKAFDEMYNKQKKYFIDDLESKMAANSMSEQDRQVIDAVKKRLDYYQAAYKRQFMVA